jgi:hypothetical protein
MIQKYLNSELSVPPGRKGHQAADPGGGSQCFQTSSSSSLPVWWIWLCKSHDLAGLCSVPSDQHGSRMQFPEVELPVVDRRLWKLCDLVDLGWQHLDPQDSKHTEECKSWSWILVFSEPAHLFGFLCGERSCGNHMIQKAWAQGPSDHSGRK